MTRSIPSLITLTLVAVAFAGCASSPRGSEARQAMREQSDAMLRTMKARDSSLEEFLARAYGYAIFPSVGKGAVIVGGAHGRGEVYVGGKFVGYAEIRQGTLGAQIGGQTFAELIAFQNQAAFERFREGKLEFTANASAVAIKSGAATATDYQNGVAVFVMPTGGLMAEAAVGGQQFSFEPAD